MYSAENETSTENEAANEERPICAHVTFQADQIKQSTSKKTDGIRRVQSTPNTFERMSRDDDENELA